MIEHKQFASGANLKRTSAHGPTQRSTEDNNEKRNRRDTQREWASLVWCSYVVNGVRGEVEPWNE